MSFVFLAMLMQISGCSNSQPTSKLIYVGDPMCSWCYGVSKEMKQTVDHFKDDLQFELVMGGLRPYNKETMLDLKDFLTHHWDDVNKASGMPFSYDILGSGSITYDTEPPCRAVVAVREIESSKALAFFKACQSAFYKDNKNMHLTASYLPICSELGISAEAFTAAFESDRLKDLVKKDFERSAKLGVNSFPTLLLESNGKQTIIARGFARSSSMIEKINSVLKEHAKN